jgi:hypothetical protein
MRALVSTLFMALVSGCGPAVESSEEDACAIWPAHHGAPATPVRPAPGAGVEVLMAKLGPFEQDVTIAGLDVATAPGWGCDTPAELSVVAWTGSPSEMLALASVPVVGERELGGGFVAQTVMLEEPLALPAGTAAGAAFVLATPASCGVTAPGGLPGRAGRWSQETGWTELDGALVLWARACED